MRPAFGYADPAAHWCQRLDDGLGHVLGLVIAKAVCGQLAARRTASGFRAAGRAVRDPESRRLGCRPDDPCCARQSPACFARRGECRSARSLRSATTGRSCRGLVARHLTLGHSVQALIVTLARALLREDAGFHAYQALDAAVRQFGEWGNTDEGRHILIAVARYLAAHSPKERAELQTAEIARRLMRGGELHREATAWHRQPRCRRRTLREAQIVIESWRRHFNTIRPHASFGYKPPAPEVFVPAFAAWPAALRQPASPAMLAPRLVLN